MQTSSNAVRDKSNPTLQENDSFRISGCLISEELQGAIEKNTGPDLT
jgi:hypothetical protein